MFQKKYIFETEHTRYARYLKNLLLGVILGFFLYSIFCAIFIIFSQKEIENTKQKFFKRPPDLISVFTGDKGRIPFALELAKQYNQPQVFITGVYANNTVETLVPINEENNLDSHFLTIDYLARNTVENVIATLRYLRKNKGLNKVLIVSHDYHLMRIKLIVDQLKDKGDPFTFNYTGVETNYNNMRNLKILYKEVFKLIRTYGFLMLWDRDPRPLTEVP